MDSISTARNFFINQQGLSPDQADMLVSKGMEAYNQQMQPQSMMQMASGGIARLGYQMGGSPMGVQAMPMDTGQALQVPQQAPTNFSSAQSITTNPLLNYGQTQLAQGGATPLTMRSGGIARLGYQDGGEAGMSEMGGEEIQMDQQQAMQTIIQILIDNGVDPETAKQLAQQILQIFMQGGAPAVEAFANQLEQEETQAMASGGIAGYAQRQGYGFGGIGKIFSGAAKAVSGVVKGVASAVKSVAKSPIGKIALTIAATYALGPAGLGIGQMASATPWIASAINAGLANTLVQGITTGKFNPKEALMAAGLGGISGALQVPGTVDNAANITTSTGTNITADLAKQGIANPNMLGLNVPAGDAVIGADIARASVDPSIAGTTGKLIDYQALAQDMSGATKPGIFQTLQTKMSDALTNPIQTLKNLGTGAVDLIEQNPKTAAAIGTGIGFGTGYALGAPQGKDESDEDFAKRQQEEVNPLITYYGRNLQIKNPYFYQKFGAVNPFETAAQGGIMGYKKGGSMVPPARQIEGGILELDARKTGGYIPYGKKERHDDVPAMLAKDEFVFTSKAVKAAGGGSAQRGAAKMYALMKQLEGARA
ncbi:hypothetical protein EB001_21075 [bacterium]|nr:hypothetical protein [bacterium]